MRLQGDLGAATEQRDNALQELRSLADNFQKRGDWIDQLQQSGDGLLQECRKLQQSEAALRHEAERLQALPAAMEALRKDHEALQAAYSDLKANYARVLRPLLWLLQLLPARARTWVVRTAKNIFFESRNG